MSTHKYIDIICVAVLTVTLVITILFMCGKSLGITTVTSEEENVMFSQNDLDAEVDFSSSTKIALDSDKAEISGSGAYFENGNVYISFAGKYVLSGSLDNGSVIVSADGEDTVWLYFDGVSINCENSAAVYIEQADKVYAILADESESFLSSGDNSINGSVDGAIYSKDDITVCGNGSLSVVSSAGHGIVCNDDLLITGGNISIQAKEDGLHANDSIRICNAAVDIIAGDDGMTASNDNSTSFIYIESGNISIPSCYEGIEAVNVTICGGSIDIEPTDDAINANEYNSLIEITGGDIRIVNANARDADGLDSNGDIKISGGKLFISVDTAGGSCAVDYGSENGGKCVIDGGTVIACGSSTMLEAISSESTQAFIEKAISTCNAESKISLTDKDGNLIIDETVPCSFSSVIISSPEMSIGDTYTLKTGEVSEEITVDNSSTGVFGSGGGGFGKGGGRVGFPESGQQNGTVPNFDKSLEDADNTAPSEIPDDNGNVLTPEEMPGDNGNMQPSEEIQGDNGNTQSPDDIPGDNGNMQTPGGMRGGMKAQYNGEFDPSQNPPMRGDNPSQTPDGSEEKPNGSLQEGNAEEMTGEESSDTSEEFVFPHEAQNGNQQAFEMQEKGDRGNFTANDGEQNTAMQKSGNTKSVLIFSAVSIVILGLGIFIAAKKKC